MVKRYEFKSEYGYGEIIPDDSDGTFVTYIDYATLQDENAKLRKVLIKVYNLGYHSGHEHTVEGCYTHIYSCDMYEYHDDIVADILKDEGVTV
jgi:hypothetical protein